jgi:hypothetical protein
MPTSLGTHRIPELWMELHDRHLLARLLKVKNISPMRLALAVGWQSRTSVARLLNGDYNCVTPEKATRIAAFLEVPVDLIFVPKISSASGEFDSRESA